MGQLFTKSFLKTVMGFLTLLFVSFLITGVVSNFTDNSTDKNQAKGNQASCGYQDNC